MRIKLDSDTLSYMHTFSDVTGVVPRDCISFNDTLVFVAPEGQVGMCVGENGVKVKLLEKLFNRKVLIVEYFDDPVKFLESFVRPIRMISGYVSVDSNNDKKIEAELSGKISYDRVKLLKMLMERYFNLKNINIR
ncbi:MAG: hypothetical protein RAK22_01655 [Nanoarchaeota archaeon]|nr:hypothetical protein [Nanoarchaeota archaeon]